MSRLQVGGLALIINSLKGEIVGMTVSLIGMHGDIEFYGGVLKDCWKVEAAEKVKTVTPMGVEFMSTTFHLPAAWLLPLGDDKGIELYGLSEEIMTRHDKECAQ